MRRSIALCLAVLTACGPGLAEIVRLRGLADRAKAACVTAPANAKAERCAQLLVCAESASEAAKSIQMLQVARKDGTAAAAAPVSGLYAGAVATCAAVGLKQ